MKYTIQQCITDDGIEVFSIISNCYEKTKYDYIREDWRRQQQEEKLKARREELKIKNKLLKLIKKVGDTMIRLIEKLM